MTQHGGTAGHYSTDGPELRGDDSYAPVRSRALCLHSSKCRDCPQWGQAIIYPRSCWHLNHTDGFVCPIPKFIQIWRLKRILRKMETKKVVVINNEIKR